jgi:hypothetical protein
MGKSWRIRRAALDAFLERSERRPTLLDELRRFLQVPDQVLAICASVDLGYQLDAAFFRLAETRGGALVKFTGGEPDRSIPESRAELARHKLDVGRLEAQGRLHFIPETDPLAGRAAALRDMLARTSAQAQVVWASFDWTQAIGLEAALRQQEAMKEVVDAGQLVVKTAALEHVADAWPTDARRLVHGAHRGLIELSPHGVTLSRRIPLRE